MEIDSEGEQQSCCCDANEFGTSLPAADVEKK